MTALAPAADSGLASRAASPTGIMLGDASVVTTDTPKARILKIELPIEASTGESDGIAESISEILSTFGLNLLYIMGYAIADV
ncbi:MAG: hypothetical protein O2967_15650 [Proteobacteria bacterium]|nr:hypothetical protein [Pseudomonadota bacterium]